MLERNLQAHGTITAIQHKRIVVLILIVVVLHSALVQAQNDNAAELKTFADFSQTLDYQYTKANLTLDTMKRWLMAKCQKLNASDEAIEAITNGTSTLRKCTNGLMNVAELYDEIEIARPAGALDTVFHKYCARRSWLLECLNEFNLKLLPCLNSEEQQQNYILMRIFYTLLDFFCHNNGDPLLLFVAEQGPECLESQKQYIINCLNATFQDYLPEKNQGYFVDEMPEFVLKPKQCLEIYDLEKCVLNHVTQCDEITPANMVEAIFRYIRKETKCQLEVEKVKMMAAAENTTITRNRGIATLPQISTFALLLCFLHYLSFILK